MSNSHHLLQQTRNTYFIYQRESSSQQVLYTIWKQRREPVSFYYLSYNWKSPWSSSVLMQWNYAASIKKNICKQNYSRHCLCNMNLRQTCTCHLSLSTTERKSRERWAWTERKRKCRENKRIRIWTRNWKATVAVDISEEQRWIRYTITRYMSRATTTATNLDNFLVLHLWPSGPAFRPQVLGSELTLGKTRLQ